MVVEPSNLYPARPRHGPKDFAWILRALSGVLNANSKPSRPRSGAGSDRSGGEGLAPSTKQPETTLKQNAVWETRYKRELAAHKRKWKCARRTILLRDGRNGGEPGCLGASKQRNLLQPRLLAIYQLSSCQIQAENLS